MVLSTASERLARAERLPIYIDSNCGCIGRYCWLNACRPGISNGWWFWANGDDPWPTIIPPLDP